MPPTKDPTYQYDAAGRLTQRTWARGAVTDYTWNNAGQLHTVQYPASTTPGVINSYDRSGRRIQVQDGSGTRVYAYTNGLLAAETWTAGPLAGWKIDRSHDSLRRPTGYDLTQTGSNAQQVAYGYDTISRINQVIGHGITNTYTYAPNRPVLQSLVQGDVQTVTYDYDFAQRLKKISTAVTNTIISSHEYTYNNRNLRVRADREDGTYWTYSYDAKGQVTGGIKYTAAGQIIPGYVFGYNYDDIGNRVDAIENARQTDYTANQLNQYTQIDRPAFTHIRGAEISTNLSFKVDGDPAQKLDKWWYASPAVSNLVSDFEILAEDPAGNKNSTNLTLLTPSGQDQPQYDNDGNLTQDHLWDYYWNSENRLTSMVHRADVDLGDKPKLRLSFQYDSQGRRWRKRVEEQSPATGQYTERYTRHFVYDDWNLIAESAADGAVSNTYTWGLDLSRTLQGAGGVGGLLSTRIEKQATADTALAVYDGNGTVIAYWTFETEAVAANFAYDPFGELLCENGPKQHSELKHRFSTKLTDIENDLIYYGFRYYSPKIGRWASWDPIGEHGGINLYGFIGNTAINASDLLGLVTVYETHVQAVQDPFYPPVNSDDYCGIDIGLGHTATIMRWARESIGILEDWGVDPENDAAGVLPIGCWIPPITNGFAIPNAPDCSRGPIEAFRPHENPGPHSNAGNNPSGIIISGAGNVATGLSAEERGYYGFRETMRQAFEASIQRAKNFCENSKCNCPSIVIRMNCPENRPTFLELAGRPAPNRIQASAEMLLGNANNKGWYERGGCKRVGKSSFNCKVVKDRKVTRENMLMILPVCGYTYIYRCEKP